MARSQNDRVLAQLRRGPVNPSQFLGLPGRPVCDGGKPIQRLGARIHVLRSRGHRIEAKRGPDGTATYKLIFDAGTDRCLPEAHNLGVVGSSPAPAIDAHAAMVSGENPEPALAEPHETAACASPSHNPLDHAHRQQCDWCADHYADLAADAADDEAAA